MLLDTFTTVPKSTTMVILQNDNGYRQPFYVQHTKIFVRNLESKVWVRSNYVFKKIETKIVSDIEQRVK